MTSRATGSMGRMDDERESVEIADCPACGYTTFRRTESGDMFSHRIRGEKQQPVCPESESMKRKPWEL